MAQHHPREPDLDGRREHPPAAYERRIEVRPGAGALVAELEDCHHHFRLRVDHDGTVLGHASAEDLRAPWATCGQGAQGIAALEGLSVSEAAAGAWARPHWRQCVHVVDLARIALAHLGGDRPLRYDLKVAPPSGPRQKAVLVRNGEEALRWSLSEGTITAPTPWRGAQVRGGEVLAVARRSGDPALVEQAFVLRRACYMAVSVVVDLDQFSNAGDIRGPDDSCWTYHAPVTLDASRRRGTSRPDGLGPTSLAASDAEDHHHRASVDPVRPLRDGAS